MVKFLRENMRNVLFLDVFNEANFKYTLKKDFGFLNQIRDFVTKIGALTRKLKKYQYGDFLSGDKKLSGFQPGHKIDKTRVKSARNGQNVRKNTSKWLRNVFYDVRLAKNDIAIFGFLFLYKIPDFITRLVPYQAIKIRHFDSFV